MLHKLGSIRLSYVHTVVVRLYFLQFDMKCIFVLFFPQVLEECAHLFGFVPLTAFCYVVSIQLGILELPN